MCETQSLFPHPDAGDMAEAMVRGREKMGKMEKMVKTENPEKMMAKIKAKAKRSHHRRMVEAR